MVVVCSGIEAIGAAARRLCASRLVVIPTETVYGLAARVSDVAALERVYALKGRPADNPLIAHVLDARQAQTITTGWDERCDLLADAFWPGPLTLVLGRARDVPPLAAGGRDTLAVRAPAHDTARAVIAEVGEPLSAPSANRSGSVSPTSAEHVQQDYVGITKAQDLLILDGGPCIQGIESTVLDLTGTTGRVLRPGTTTVADIESVIGPVQDAPVTGQSDSPGTARRHYAPSTPVTLIHPDGLGQALSGRDDAVAVLAGAGVSVPKPHVHVSPGDTPEDWARHLYAALRRADAMDLAAILVVQPPEDPAWVAVRDRLMRAASPQ